MVVEEGSEGEGQACEWSPVVASGRQCVAASAGCVHRTE